MTPKPLFSADCREAAALLRSIRTKLQEMVKEGHWPEGSWHDLSTVIVSGHFVIRSLERLGNDESRTPTHLDDRR